MKLSTSTKRAMIELGMKYIARHGALAMFWTVNATMSLILLAGAMSAQSEGHEQSEMNIMLLSGFAFYAVFRTAKYIYTK